MSEEKHLVKYETTMGEVKLTAQMVKNFLVSGDKDKITTEEVVKFITLCQYQKLNPWLGEAYLIKYGTSPATMVVGYEVFLKRAQRHEHYDGFEFGLSKWDEAEKVAWGKVYRKDYSIPIYVEVDFDEYVGLKKDGSVNKMWKGKPKTMLKKVALSQALRLAFPEELGGLYTSDEINTISKELPKDEIQQPEFTVDEETGEISDETPPEPVIKNADQPLTEEQIEQLKYRAGGNDKILMELIRNFKVDSLGAFKQQDFSDALDYIEAQKETQAANVQTEM